MRIPLVYTASEIATWHVSEEYLPGKWQPARPCGFNYWTWEWIKYRFRICWRVFKGDLDVLNWQGSGELSNTETHYKDCLDPEFTLVK